MKQRAMQSQFKPVFPKLPLLLLSQVCDICTIPKLLFKVFH